MTELLVVCAILGIVLAGVLSLLMVGQQSATTTSNKVDAQANARVGIERMIEEIREAASPPAAPTCPGPPPHAVSSLQLRLLRYHQPECHGPDHSERLECQQLHT